MTTFPYSTALVIGAGSGISASVARALAAAGVKVGLAAREVRKLSALATEIGAETFNADATNLMDVVTLFDEMERRLLCSLPCCPAGRTAYAPTTCGRHPSYRRLGKRKRLSTFFRICDGHVRSARTSAERSA